MYSEVVSDHRFVNLCISIGKQVDNHSFYHKRASRCFGPKCEIGPEAYMDLNLVNIQGPVILNLPK